MIKKKYSKEERGKRKEEKEGKGHDTTTTTNNERTNTRQTRHSNTPHAHARNTHCHHHALGNGEERECARWRPQTQMYLPRNGRAASSSLSLSWPSASSSVAMMVCLGATPDVGRLAPSAARDQKAKAKVLSSVSSAMSQYVQKRDDEIAAKP